MWNGADEWIWRPLVNSPVVRTNSFLDVNPKGFGLLQRDRNFDHYLDDGANYHLRPCAWVEPLDEWGRGAVQLVEIPTPDETFDNIVVFWNPEEPFQAGQERVFKYRLHWGEPPVSSSAAKVIATRIGAGGIPGQKNRIPSRKFVIDFEGGRLSDLPETAKVEPVITVSRGQIKEPAARPLRGTNAWRCNFDLISEGSEPIDLRCYLRDELGALTETWLYQWTPPA
jgi:glucans biosynthesis protein